MNDLSGSLKNLALKDTSMYEFMVKICILYEKLLEFSENVL